MSNNAEQAVKALFREAGIGFGNEHPWDIRVRDDRFYTRVLKGGSLAFGETYVDGWWDCEALDECIFRLLRSQMESKVKTWRQVFIEEIWSRFVNIQAKWRAREQGGAHYNRGNKLFSHMLGQYMVYSCGYWKDAGNIDDAQRAKMDLICRKIGLQKGHKVLDIGCGWGELAKYAAEMYGAEVTGITMSEEQAKYGRALCKELPVEIRIQDYRDVSGQFDRVVSVGMFEHVGYKNYQTFMRVAERCLKDEGIFLLHTIGGNSSSRSNDPWLDKYIFPGSLIPSLRQVADASEGLFICEDLHNFGPDYDKTLMAWHENFLKHWDVLKSDYDERFFRMWKYYLLVCTASFRARKNQLWQFVFSKHGIMPNYRSIR